MLRQRESWTQTLPDCIDIFRKRFPDPGGITWGEKSGKIAKIFFAPQAGAAKSHAWTSFSPVARVGPEFFSRYARMIGALLKCLGPWGRYAPIPIKERKTLIMVVFATWFRTALCCKRVSSFITDATDALQRPLPHRELCFFECFGVSVKPRKLKRRTSSSSLPVLFPRSSSSTRTCTP